MTRNKARPRRRLDSADRRKLKTAKTNVAWHEALAGLIDDGMTRDVPRQMVRALMILVPIELAAMFVFRGRSRPLHIFDNFELADAEKGVQAFLENTYILNPVYHACLQAIDEGVYRIRDLAPDAYFESGRYRALSIQPKASEEIGYITHDWPEGLEEVDILITLEPDIYMEFSVYREFSAGGFSDDDIEQLSAVRPVIGAILRQYWSTCGRLASETSPPDNHVDDAVARFGELVLTDREREIAQLILRGHSSESICVNLGISIGTVKTHRKNIHTKLNISSQAELMAMFLDSLK